MKNNISSKASKLFYNHNKICKYISSSEKLNYINHTFSIKPIHNPYLEPEKFKKLYGENHPHSKYVEPFSKMIYSGFYIGWFNMDRDTDLETARWDCNGAYPNKIANVLYRSKSLKSKFLMNFFCKRVDSSNSIEYNIAEPQPQITSNSVFIFKDTENANYFINRRSLERLFAVFLIAQGVNLTGAIMYIYLGIYFGLIQKVISSTKTIVVRMDLIPETEQIHFIKVGMFGLPRSVLVNIKDLQKIPYIQEMTYPLKWYKSALWYPRENKELVYKDKLTNEVFTFGKTGVWNRKGINHELII